MAWVYTHDSVGLGEDGPTHQPVEHLAALRAIPGLVVMRPGDANETAAAWRVILEDLEGPAVLVLSRQDLPVLARGRLRRRRRAAPTSCATPTTRAPRSSGTGVGGRASPLAAADELARRPRARRLDAVLGALRRARTRTTGRRCCPPALPSVSVEAGISMGWEAGSTGRSRSTASARARRVPRCSSARLRRRRDRGAFAQVALARCVAAGMRTRIAAALAALACLACASTASAAMSWNAASWARAPLSKLDGIPANATLSAKNAEFIENFPLTSDSAGARLVGHYFYITTERDLTIFDVSTPEAPQQVGHLQFPASDLTNYYYPQEDPDTNGKILLTTDEGALEVIDVSDKANPHFLSKLPGTQQHTISCALDCTWAYGSCGSLSCKTGEIIDLRDPEHPRLAGDWVKQLPRSCSRTPTTTSPRSRPATCSRRRRRCCCSTYARTRSTRRCSPPPASRATRSCTRTSGRMR